MERGEKTKTKVIATRVTKRFADLLQEYCQHDAHVNLADLIRDAIREKIQKDAPELYAKLFQEDKK
ncbi:MAG: hypothetical protein QXO67_00750 [Candidatus Bathyarchaeia archaeon]